MIRFQKLNEFIPLYWFLQCNGVGNILFRFIHKLFAPLIAIGCMMYKDVYCIGAFDKDNLIGLLIYSKRFNKINYLCVKQEYRKLGIAKQMIVNSGCDCVCISQQARGFWIKKGFERAISPNILMKVKT